MAATYSSSNSANIAVPATITPSKVKAQTVPKVDAEVKENYLQSHEAHGFFTVVFSYRLERSLRQSCTFGKESYIS